MAGDKYSGLAIRRKNRGRGPRNLDYLKPPKFRNYLTIGEVAEFVPVDPKWLVRLEKADRIPRAQRVQRGKLSVRLWSPKQAEEIRRIIEGHHVGRPPQD